MNPTYLKYEIVRTMRNRQSYLFSLLVPLIMFLIFGTANSDANFNGTGVSARDYYMAGMISFGAMGTMIASGARIAVDRQVGWNRQLRLSPLTPGRYLAAKVAVGYLTAALTIAVLFVAGIASGVTGPVDRWLVMTGLVLVALVPFAAIGIWAGHTFSTDGMGPLIGGAMTFFALLGGAWFPFDGWLGTVGTYLPSYWIVRAGRVFDGGRTWPVQGWLVVAVWTAVFVALAVRAYRRDTRRS